MAKKAKQALKKPGKGWLGDPTLVVIGIAVVLAGVLATARGGNNGAKIGRYDAVSNREVETAEKALADAHASKSNVLGMDLQLLNKLCGFRRMDEAEEHINKMFRMLGGPDKAKNVQPVLGLLHAQITGALGSFRQDDALVKRASRLAQSFKKGVKRWQNRVPSPHPQSYYAALRPYHVLHSSHGYPPPPFLDDGVEASRAQRKKREGTNTSGFAGRRSSYATTNADCNVDRRDWRTLSEDDFLRDYHEAGAWIFFTYSSTLNLCILSCIHRFSFFSSASIYLYTFLPPPGTRLPLCSLPLTYLIYMTTCIHH
jgi:hypothetical protein